MKYVLFSPIGNSDPIRKDFDGPFLHIVRHYHPRKAYLFLTKEMVKRFQEFNVYDRYAKYVDPNMLIEYIETDISDPSDFELFIRLFSAEIERIAKENPRSTILINMTSGTSQMTSALTMIIGSLSFKLLPIQVKIHTSAAGGDFRTPPEYLDPELHEDEVVPFWWDQQPEMYRELTGRFPENRCYELRLGSYTRTRVIQQLKSSDYQGAYQIANNNKNDFSKEEIEALHGAAYRATYHLKEAEECFKKASMDVLVEHENRKVIEYYLTMKWRCERHDYAPFILSITPMTFELLVQYLRNTCGFEMKNATRQGSKRNDIDAEKLEREYPMVYQKLSAKYGHISGYWSSDSLLATLNCFVDQMEGEKKKKAAHMADCFGWLRNPEPKLRNQTAHELRAISQQDVELITQCSESEMLRRMDQMVHEVTGVEKSAFNSYRHMRNQLIKMISEYENK